MHVEACVRKLKCAAVIDGACPKSIVVRASSEDILPPPPNARYLLDWQFIRKYQPQLISGRDWPISHLIFDHTASAQSPIVRAIMTHLQAQSSSPQRLHICSKPANEMPIHELQLGIGGTPIASLSDGRERAQTKRVMGGIMACLQQVHKRRQEANVLILAESELYLHE